MAERKTYARNQAYQEESVRQEYIYGNTVRKTMPKRMPVQEEEESVYQQEHNRSIRHHRKQADTMNGIYVLYLIAVLIAMFSMCVYYLNTVSMVNNTKKNIVALEKEYQEKKSDNDTFESSLEAKIDIEEIKQAATGELGMVTPGKDQIVSVERKESDYVVKYEKMP